jgi:hypothetical protein
MATKRDFELAAAIVAEIASRDVDAVRDAFVRYFRLCGPRFDEMRFRAACDSGEVTHVRARVVAA